jgi:hypothetical protein
MAERFSKNCKALEIETITQMGYLIATVATFWLPLTVDVTYSNEPSFIAEEYRRSFILKDQISS